MTLLIISGCQPVKSQCGAWSGPRPWVMSHVSPIQPLPTAASINRTKMLLEVPCHVWCCDRPVGSKGTLDPQKSPSDSQVPGSTVLSPLNWPPGWRRGSQRGSPWERTVCPCVCPCLCLGLCSCRTNAQLHVKNLQSDPWVQRPSRWNRHGVSLRSLMSFRNSRERLSSLHRNKSNLQSRR